MSYVKTDWTTGDVITAEKLNHIETYLSSMICIDAIFYRDVYTGNCSVLGDYDSVVSKMESSLPVFAFYCELQGSSGGYTQAMFSGTFALIDKLNNEDKLVFRFSTSSTPRIEWTRSSATYINANPVN